jgi:hypothetical protein
MDKDIHEAISVASGYGIASLALQFASVKRFAKRVGLAPSEGAFAFAEAKQFIESAVIDASPEARVAAQNHLENLKAIWLSRSSKI